MKKIKGGVTTPLGFSAMGLRVGIKEEIVRKRTWQ